MKLLFISSAPNLSTGFGKMGRYVAEHLSKELGKENFLYLGLGQNQYSEAESEPFNIEYAGQDKADEDGKLTFNKLVDEFKPDIVFSFGDLWQFEWLKDHPKRSGFVWIFWLPIDGAPIPHFWMKTLADVDLVLTTSAWGKALIELRDKVLSSKVFVLRHGVDTDLFRPPVDLDEKARCKTLLGVPQNSFVVGIVARNQLRKNFPALLGAFSKFVRPYTICNNRECPPTYGTSDKCGTCLGPVFYKEPKYNTSLYLHTDRKSDVGWDLHDLVADYGLGEYVYFPAEVTQPGVGVTDKRLSEIYKAFDLFVLPTMGEGFGIPLLEAMASGVPCIATDYSGHVEFVAGNGILIPTLGRFREQITGTSRALIKENDLYQAMDLVFYDKHTDFTEKHAYSGLKPWLSDQLNLIHGKQVEEYGGPELRTQMALKSVLTAQKLSIKSMLTNLTLYVKMAQSKLGNRVKSDKNKVDII